MFPLVKRHVRVDGWALTRRVDRTKTGARKIQSLSNVFPPVLPDRCNGHRLLQSVSQLGRHPAPVSLHRLCPPTYTFQQPRCPVESNNPRKKPLNGAASTYTTGALIPDRSVGVLRMFSSVAFRGSRLGLALEVPATFGLAFERVAEPAGSLLAVWFETGVAPMSISGVLTVRSTDPISRMWVMSVMIGIDPYKGFHAVVAVYGSGSTPPPSRWSLPATTRNGSAQKPPGLISVGWHRYRPARGGSSGIG